MCLCCKGICFIKTLLTFRRLFILCLLACFGLLIGSNIIESFFYVIPCQLCILQRCVYYALAILFFIGAVHNPKNIGRYVYAFSSFVFSILGALIAGRQIWIQHLPLEQVPECAPGLERLIALHPLLDVLKIVFKGTSECFKVHFTILGLPLSNWSFVSFVGFSCVCLFIIYGQKKRWI
jgi:disulfide bond formation protein DsbB